MGDKIGRRRYMANVMTVPYGVIAEALVEGQAIPFFGAAASAVYRPKDDSQWVAGCSRFMPFGGELAAELANDAGYPTAGLSEVAVTDLLQIMRSIAENNSVDEAAQVALKQALRKHFERPPDLALVASYTEMQGNRRLMNQLLRKYLTVECEPGLLQKSLAAIEKARLYVTTNYDDILEKALASRKPFVLIDRGGEKGLLVAALGEPLQPIAATGKDLHELFEAPQNRLRPIVFKIHGSIDRFEEKNDCYLITEEDYVDFLGRAPRSYVPPYISGLMEGKHLLFLGHSLADWNIRVIMRKLLKRTKNSTRFWAIVNGPSEAEQEIWSAKNLKIFAVDLVTFAQMLDEKLQQVLAQAR
jgi:hypothetical protein